MIKSEGIRGFAMRFLSLFFLLSLTIMGCSSAVDSTDDDSAEDADSSGDDDSVDSELTLSNCSTSIAEDAPDFFATYFKCVTISLDGSSVVMVSNGLPPHRSYYYGEDDPNFAEFDESRGEEYAPNPNQIAEQDINITIPLEPTAKGLVVTEAMVDGVVGTNADEYSLGAVGVALDGVPLFNPLAAPGDDIEAERFTFDSYNSHPTGDGEYHYHADSAGPLEVLEALGLVTNTTPGSAEVEIYGIMCDGTVVLGCTELDGSVPDASDFDPQNGHLHDLVDVEDNTLFANRYHVHMCTTLFSTRSYTPEIQFYVDCTIN